MTIDESIEIIISAKPERPTSMYGIMKKNAFNTAIDTMRKYEKIQEIVSSKTTRLSYEDGFRQIKEVLEDGNDTTNTGSN